MPDDEIRESAHDNGGDPVDAGVSDPIYGIGNVVGVVIVAILVVGFFVAILAIPVALGIAIYNADPGQLAPRENAGYLDLIISNRAVVWSIRGGLMIGIAVLFVVAIYIVISVSVRTAKGHWLRSGAGLQADVSAAREEIQDVDDVVWDLLAEAQQEKDQLTIRLAETTDGLEEVTEQRNWLLDQLDEFAKEADGDAADEDA
ncbi:hypothetical protein [Gaiella sp.]|uniref:hypothetical protein n=1 Tax=Gaiella sp. TaxID=2663207 RepID=UPI003983B9A5